MQPPSTSLRRVKPWIVRFRRAYGVRVVTGWGVQRTLRALGLVVWAGLLVNVILVARPDLLHTSDFGLLIRPCTWHPVSDSRSAEISTNCPRAIARCRPTIPPLGRCPSSHRRRWRFPGQQCRGFPSRIRFYLPWALGVAGTIAAGALFLQRAPGLLVLVALPFLKGLAITAWSGNVNALIASAALFTWWAGEPHARRAAAVTAGAITATIGAVKLGPSLFWVWIAGRRTPDAPLSGFLAIAGLTGLVLVALGPAPFQEYLQIATASASDPSALSLLGVLKGVGVPAGVASMLWVSTVVALGIAAIMSRQHPVPAFTAAAAGLVLLTPIVRVETISVALVVAGTPWVARTPPTSIRRTFATAGFVALMAVGWSIATGGLDRSSFHIENATDEPVIVRFSAPGWSASWGYLVQPHQIGTGWSDEVGSVAGPFQVFDSACDVVAVAELPSGGGAFRLEAGGLTEWSGAMAGVFPAI